MKTDVTADENVIAAGDRIDAAVNGAPIRGVIDTMMPDGSIIWVQLDEGRGRRMLHRDELQAINHRDTPGQIKVPLRPLGKPYQGPRSMR